MKSSKNLINEIGEVPLLLLSAVAALILVTSAIVVITPLRNALFNNSSDQNNTPEINTSETEILSNQILIKAKKNIKIKEDINGTGINSLDKKLKESSAKKVEKIAKENKNSKKDAEIFSWYKVTLGGEEKVTKIKITGQEKTLSADDQETKGLISVIDSLKTDDSIEAAEPNYIVKTTQETHYPNDPLYWSKSSWGQSYDDLWGMKKINPLLGFKEASTSAEVIVANIDTGIDYNHEDLKEMVWVNKAEIPNNNLDDDTNGYVDDYYGWDFVSNDKDPMDDHGHGTHTAGTITAKGNNNLGVTGVSWNTKVMSLKFLDSSGYGSYSNAVKALQYAADMGAKISSNSWSGSFSKITHDAIKYEHEKGMVIVVAAGNYNSDALEFSPAASEKAITVAATDWNDAKASFSNHGPKIDIAAPGVDILSTKSSNGSMCDATKTVNTKYCHVSGTSMATPHVSGLIALLWGKDPSLSNEQIRQLLRSHSTDLGTVGQDNYFGFGRIEVNSLISNLANKPPTVIITSPVNRDPALESSILTVKGSANGGNFASYKLEAGSGRNPSQWITINQSTQPITNGTLGIIEKSKLPTGSYTIKLTVTDNGAKNFIYQVFDIQVDNFISTITSPNSLVSLGTNEIVGSAATKNGAVLGSYTIEWGEGTNPTTWSKDGISLANNGSQPILNGKLANWDTSLLKDNQDYSIKLLVNSNDGGRIEKTMTVKVDKDLVSGWPKALASSLGNTNAGRTSHSVLADLNGDGTKEIIITTEYKLYALKSDGTNYPGFPISAAPDFYFNTPPNVEDINHDGQKEIIISAITFTDWYNFRRKILIFTSSGIPYPNWPNPLVRTNGIKDVTPVVFDINSDGSKDLIVLEGNFSSTNNAKLHAYTLNGTEITGFPKTLTHSPNYYSVASPIVGDLDKDGKGEIVLSIGNKIYLFDNQGNIVSGWPYTAPLNNNNNVNFESPASIGDINNDGVDEVFAAACSSGTYDVIGYGFKKDGSLLTNWPQRLGVSGMCPTSENTTSMGDVDNDGKTEVVFSSDNIYIYKDTGLLKKFNFNSQNIGRYIPGTWISGTEPALVDINGDSILEILTSVSDAVTISKDYQKFWQRLNTARYYWFDTLVADDIDNDKKLEIVVTSHNIVIDNNAHTLAYLWKIPAASGEQPSISWPMFKQNSTRNGNIKAINQIIIPTPTPIPTPQCKIGPIPTP